MGPKENEGAVTGAAAAGADGEGADVGPKENEGAVEDVVVAGAAVENADAGTGLAKKFGTAEVGGTYAVVGAGVVGGCVAGWPSENFGAADTVCGADTVNGLEVLEAGAETAGVTLAGAAVDAAVEIFEASVLDGVGPNENAGGAAFASVPEGAGAAGVVGGGGVNVMMGIVGALGPSSGAVALGVILDGVSALFCSNILARILAIASASRSCFSHFENARNPGREGTSATP